MKINESVLEELIELTNDLDHENDYMSTNSFKKLESDLLEDKLKKRGEQPNRI